MNIWTSFVNFYAEVLRSLANFFGVFGGLKWALATVVLTIIIRTLLLPLAIKQIRGMREMQRLQPEVARLKQKYRADRQKLTQETMALYQREGVNPYSSCLPMIAQMPIIFAFYQALQRRILALPVGLADLVKAKVISHANAVSIAQKLSSVRTRGAEIMHLEHLVKAKSVLSTLKDKKLPVPNVHAISQAFSQHPFPHMPFFGLGDLTRPASTTIAGWLLLAVMTIAQLLSTRQLNMGQTDQQKRMQMLMPFMFIFIFRQFPAILVLYWTTQNVYQLVQQMVMTRDMRGKGWRGWLGLDSAQPKTKGSPARGKSNGQASRQASRGSTKPQVKAPIQTPEPVAAVAAAAPFDALASRRQLEEKRQRRRRNKKRKRRR